MDLSQLEKLANKLNQINYEKVKGEFQREVRANLSSNVTDFVYDNWSQGVKGNGIRIGRYNDLSYAADKALMNPAPGFGNVDLIYTGAFSNALFMPRNNEVISVSSSDSKTGELVAKYGDDIFDLSEDQEFDVIDEAKEYVYDNLLNWLFDG